MRSTLDLGKIRLTNRGSFDMSIESSTNVSTPGRLELRPFQSEDVAKILAAFDRVDRVLYVLPTGGGKTEVAIEVLARNLASQRDSRVVWLTHRQELREQSQERIEGAGVSVVDLTDTSPPKRRLLLGGVAIVSPGMRTAHQQIEQATARDLLIVDEAHHSVANSWDRNFIRPWPGRVLGVTATPWRMSRKEGFDHLYQELVCGPSVRELIDQGYLCDFNLVTPVEEVIKGLGRGPDGDYSVAETEAANSPVFYTELAIKVWKDKASHSHRTIWYTLSVDSAEALTRNLKSQGYQADMVHAKTPAELRRRIIAGFDSGDLEHLVNVAIVTEGFDCPDADCVVVLRPTKSLALYRQMVGRALRPKPGKRAMILDLGRVSMERGVGHPADDYPWSLGLRGSAEDGVAPIRWCQDCEVVNPGAARHCVSCGVPFGQDCEGCGRWRFYLHWEDPDTDVLCRSCQLGLLVDHVITQEDLPGDWKANPANDVLWHDSKNCLVMLSRREPRSWVVGFRRHGGGGRMTWFDGYASFREAHEAAQVYVRSGYIQDPSAPAPVEGQLPVAPGVPIGWGWNADGTVLWHSSRRCLVKASGPGSECFILGYNPREGAWAMRWLMGYPSLQDTVVAGEFYIANEGVGRPPPASPEHEAGPAWVLGLAGYGVMPNRYGPGWIFYYTDRRDGRENRVYTAGYETEAEALVAAMEHLEVAGPC